MKKFDSDKVDKIFTLVMSFCVFVLTILLIVLMIILCVDFFDPAWVNHVVKILGSSSEFLL